MELEKAKIAEKEKERQLELELATLAHEEKLARDKLDAEVRRASITSTTSNQDHTTRAKTPRLPVFVDGKDNLDSYLERFEMFAETQGWERDDWANTLSALLSGRA